MDDYQNLLDPNAEDFQDYYEEDQQEFLRLSPPISTPVKQLTNNSSQPLQETSSYVKQPISPSDKDFDLFDDLGK